MLEFLKKKWIEWLISILIVVITVVLTNSFAVRRDSNADIKKKLEEKASKEYVDKQDATMKDYIDKENENVINLLDQSVKAQTGLINSMDQKLNILIDNKK
jgi:uncharacterized membrane protein